MPAKARQVANPSRNPEAKPAPSGMGRKVGPEARMCKRRLTGVWPVNAGECGGNGRRPPRLVGASGGGGVVGGGGLAVHVRGAGSGGPGDLETPDVPGRQSFRPA